MIREAVGVEITARDDVIRVRGDRAKVAVARSVLDRLCKAAKEKRSPTRREVLDLIADESAHAEDLMEAEEQLERRHSAELSGEYGSHRHEPPAALVDLGGPAWSGTMQVYAGGRPVRPKTQNQRVYLEAIRRHDLVFGIGPAGTGKTYLAVAAAVHLLKIGRVQRVVLARPAVEAGERLGFLPGGLEEKVNPYLRPLLDALHDMLDYPTIRRFMENDVIELSPLAFMRGRTLNNAAVILDEAQNTTKGQMKMFLTRLGHGSRAIVTGDTTQIDLPDPTESGLVDAARRLRRGKGVSFIQLQGEDVVRHELVQRIVEAYGEEERARPHAAALREALADAPPPPEPPVPFADEEEEDEPEHPPAYVRGRRGDRGAGS